MNTYLIEIELYFKGKETFEVCAFDKKEALITARVYADRIWGTDYKSDSIRCVKKLQK